MLKSLINYLGMRLFGIEPYRQKRELVIPRIKIDTRDITPEEFTNWSREVFLNNK